MEMDLMFTDDVEISTQTNPILSTSCVLVDRTLEHLTTRVLLYPHPFLQGNEILYILRAVMPNGRPFPGVCGAAKLLSV